MTRRPAYFTNILLIATWLAVGCTSSGTLGCGSGNGSSEPTVDSDLLGVYQVDRYQGSGDGCGELMDLDGNPRLVLRSVPSTGDPKQAILVGQFCSSVDDCRARAKAPPTRVDYSFFEGSDAEGWQGWGITNAELVGDQCLFDVQLHNLASSSEGVITIDTRQVETEFMPIIPEGSTQATCRITDAIESIDEDSPCQTLFSLEATFETTL